jgi:long-chain acyl-CoA synthetase
MDKVWHKHYDPGVPHTIDPDQYPSLTHMLDFITEKHSNKTAFINFNTHITFQAVDDLSKRFAGFLQHDCGCQKGDRIAMLMLNTLQYPVAIFGALRAGLVVVGISPLSLAEEVDRILQDTTPTCVLVLANLAPILESALTLTQAHSIKTIIVSHIGDLLGVPKGSLINFVANYKAKTPAWHLPNAIDFKKTIQKKYQSLFVKANIEPDDIAFLSYTSKRDASVAKCAMLTHRNSIAQILQVDAWTFFYTNQVINVAEKNPFFCMMPLYYSTLVLVTLSFSLRGLPTILALNPLDIPSLVSELKKIPVFGILGIHSLIRALVEDGKIKEADFSNLRLSAGWGGFFGLDMLRWKMLTGSTLVEGYGSAEAPILFINPFSLKRYNAKIGLPLPSTEAKICDDNGNELPLNMRGELWVRGPQVMKGYWKKPELTQATITNDGWLKTGDIMTVNEEGYFAFVDRKTDVIITDAGPIYPCDIEVVIAFMRGIKEVNVASSKTKENKTIIKAFVVKNQADITEEMILLHCETYLLPEQVPNEIEFREALPKTDMGYTFRRLLREENDSH